MPGFGTFSVPFESYWETYCLDAFDMIFVVYAGRLTADDITLYKRLKSCGISTAIVRNKADEMINSIKRENPTLSDAAAFERSVGEVANELKSNGLDGVPFFLVSAYMWQDKRQIGHESKLLEFMVAATARRF